MGTDINLRAEERDGPGSPWRSLNWPGDHERNYPLFTLLAGARHGRFEAEPIAPLKGFPEDASGEVQAAFDISGAHPASTPSFLTVAELLRHDWERTWDVDTLVPPGDYELLLWRADRRAFSWPVGYFIDNAGTRSMLAGSTPEADFVAMLEEAKDRPPTEADLQRELEYGFGEYSLDLNNPGAHLHTRDAFPDVRVVHVRWSIPHHVLTGSFWVRVMPRLLNRTRSRSHDDARIVFWFD